jgi:hypothetical protein
MIKNRDVAFRVLNENFRSIKILEESIVYLQDSGSKEDIGTYKIAVGSVMAEFYDSIIDAILSEHPDLVPDSYKDWCKPEK